MLKHKKSKGTKEKITREKIKNINSTSKAKKVEGAIIPKRKTRNFLVVGPKKREEAEKGVGSFS